MKFWKKKIGRNFEVIEKKFKNILNEKNLKKNLIPLKILGPEAPHPHLEPDG